MSVYLAARDLSGVPVGTHQFIIVVQQSNPYAAPVIRGETVYSRPLGGGKRGYVVGAHNHENLLVEFFEESDYQATREFFDPSLVKWWKSDFDTEARRVDFGTKGTAAGVVDLFRLIENFAINEEYSPIEYPAGGFGYNSNSWASTIVELAGGKVDSNLNGHDVAHRKRIPKTYFEAVCPIEPRPVLN